MRFYVPKSEQNAVNADEQISASVDLSNRNGFVQCSSN